MHIVVKYENTNKIQPLNIVYISEEESIAKEKAYNLALTLYGNYVEDLKTIRKKYITNNFWHVKSIADYSDWSINLDGTFDNIVFSVIEIPDGILNY